MIRFIAMIDQKLMQRTEKHLSGSQWFSNFKPNYATDEEIQSFMVVNRQALSEIS